MLRVSDENGEMYPVIIAYEEELQQTLSGGANLGIGVYAEVGAILMRFNINYHYHFRPLIVERILATNLAQSPDAVSEHAWSGNHLGFGVTLFPVRKKEYKLKNRYRD